MQTVSPGLHRVARERACVLYHKATGAIYHIQHVIVIEGGHSPSDHEIEEMCRQAISNRTLDRASLDTLHVDRSAFQPFKVYQVDPNKRVLIEREHKR
jgi:hypothetical protein